MQFHKEKYEKDIISSTLNGWRIYGSFCTSPVIKWRCGRNDSWLVTSFIDGVLIKPVTNRSTWIEDPTSALFTENIEKGKTHEKDIISSTINGWRIYGSFGTSPVIKWRCWCNDSWLVTSFIDGVLIKPVTNRSTWIEDPTSALFTENIEKGKTHEKDIISSTINGWRIYGSFSSSPVIKWRCWNYDSRFISSFIDGVLIKPSYPVNNCE